MRGKGGDGGGGDGNVGVLLVLIGGRGVVDGEY